MTLRNLADGRRYAVRERKATYEVRPGGCLSGRIFPFEGAYLLSGVMDLWPDEAADWLKREFRKLTRNKGGTPIRPPDVERYVHRSRKSVDDEDDVEDLD